MVGTASGGDAVVDLAASLAEIEDWGADFCAAAVCGPDGLLASRGDLGAVVRVASLTKLVTAWGCLIAIEEGAVSLDDPAGPPGATVAHLLCHASGLDFDTAAVLARPGTRRIYSNTGYEYLAAHIESATSMPFSTYVAEGVLDPLGMANSELRGSAAKDLHSDVTDMLALLGEFRHPVLIDSTTASAARSVQFPGLAGVLPGWGRQDPCDWGYGPELKGTKAPHWMGATADPLTLGHFGGSGCLLWLDPADGPGCVALSDRDFGEWSVRLWPGFSDSVRVAGRRVIAGGIS